MVDSLSSAARDQSEDEEHEQGTADGDEPRLDRPEILVANARNEAGDPSADHGTQHSEQNGDEPPGLLTEDQLGDDARDDPENKEGKPAH